MTSALPMTNTPNHTALRAASPQNETTKRLFDVVVAASALVLLSPLFLLVVVCIWLTDRGPPFFRQMRVGKNGREFAFYKFRSMIECADAAKSSLLALNQHNDPRTFKMKNDPRVTRVGAILRRTSIDELPQLWNIVIGDMSIVGPRPAIPAETALYTPSDRRRLAVTPGLTCIWQVSGRSEIAFSGQVDLDLEYIRKRTFVFDLILIARTIPAVLSARGAY
jgi:lipopolysaccharide/colanic/teichoic acid biosynthesis glycosyltransferase